MRNGTTGEVSEKSYGHIAEEVSAKTRSRDQSADPQESKEPTVEWKMGYDTRASNQMTCPMHGGPH